MPRKDELYIAIAQLMGNDTTRTWTNLELAEQLGRHKEVVMNRTSKEALNSRLEAYRPNNDALTQYYLPGTSPTLRDIKRPPPPPKRKRVKSLKTVAKPTSPAAAQAPTESTVWERMLAIEAQITKLARIDAPQPPASRALASPGLAVPVSEVNANRQPAGTVVMVENLDHALRTPKGLTLVTRNGTRLSVATEAVDMVWGWVTSDDPTAQVMFEVAQKTAIFNTLAEDLEKAHEAEVKERKRAGALQGDLDRERARNRELSAELAELKANQTKIAGPRKAAIKQIEELVRNMTEDVNA